MRALLEASGLPFDSFGLHVQPVARPAAAPLLSLNAELPFQMASTVKLVTALAALELLGPAYCWRTQVHLEGALRGARLLGDLVITGGGDALLRAEHLRRWFADMQARGLREVWGDIVLDRHAIDLAEGDHSGTPSPAPDQPRYTRPDALMLDAGVLRVGLHGSTRQAAVVSLEPKQAGLPVINRLTAGRQCRATAQVERGAADARLVVRGEWARGCGDREIAQLAMPHSELSSRAVAELWREAGGRLKGGVRNRARERGTAASTTGVQLGDAGSDDFVATTADEPWTTWTSPPLTALVHEMNKVSDNQLARTLMLSLTPGFPQRPATLPAARAQIAAWLQVRGLGDADIAVDNGAGLSPAERGRPRALVHLLHQAWRGPHAQPFVASLPVAGVDGTLWRRMNGGPAARRAHLKTGSGIETRSLAGYVRCASGRVQALAAFVNHAEAPRTEALLDSVVEWVATNG